MSTGKPSADEIRSAAQLLERFAGVLDAKGLAGTGEHLALAGSARFLRSLVRDSERPHEGDVYRAADEELAE